MDILRKSFIKTLENELINAPSHSIFGDDNHEQIRLGIQFLKKEIDMDSIREVFDYQSEEHQFIISLIECLNGIDDISDIIWNEKSVVRPQDLSEETNKIVVCKTMCGGCPFSKTSTKGFLADYTFDEFTNSYNNEISLPCHSTFTETKTLDEVETEVKNGKLPICRGYVESYIKSCKLPRHNKKLIKAIEIVKEQGLSDNSMSLHQFINHHKTH